ncbi:MAG: helix-turn-helix domain-containing protein [Streptococcaceae bacterium]|jgi:phage repressor protein C with HTH and peptisase S24 domain|nr:helix-turn-helix domain-containing protein [Streptococcaceae bacterium]
MMSLEGKLTSLRKNFGYTQEQAAERLGVSQVAYRNWEKGLKHPTPSNLTKLAKVFQVSAVYLKDEDEAGELINAYTKLHPLRQRLVVNYANAQLKEQDNKAAFAQKRSSYIEVKVFERVSAGLGSGVIGDGDYDTVLSEQGLPRFDIATWVDGDSMEPKYANRSVVLLSDTRFDYDGAVYAVFVPDSNVTYLKRVYRESEGLRLESYNKKYPDRFISYEDNPQIVGKVVGNFQPIEI